MATHCVAWRSGTTTLSIRFIAPIDCLKIQAQDIYLCVVSKKQIVHVVFKYLSRNLLFNGLGDGRFNAPPPPVSLQQICLKTT